VRTLHVFKSARLIVSGLAGDSDGSLLLIEGFRNEIERLAPEGRLVRVAGSGSSASCDRKLRDGIPATAADLCDPAAAARTNDGDLLIADAGHDRIRKVSRTGIITTVAGTSHGFAGDGGPATAARLAHPCAVVPTDDGGFLIADSGNNRIRNVTRDGTITTMAGTGALAELGGCPGSCGGGCGGVDYDPLWNYFYITGKPYRAKAHRQYASPT
jgi:hypothetical protein